LHVFCTCFSCVLHVFCTCFFMCFACLLHVFFHVFCMYFAHVFPWVLACILRFILLHVTDHLQESYLTIPSDNKFVRIVRQNKTQQSSSRVDGWQKADEKRSIHRETIKYKVQTHEHNTDENQRRIINRLLRITPNDRLPKIISNL
jgi:hypothetical protein